MGRQSLVLALTLLAASLPAAADAAWLQIRAGNVRFLSDASEADLRSTVERFDQFRDVISRAFPSVVTASPVPTVVVLFRSGRTFNAYKPAVDGHVVTGVRGYVLASDDLNYLALNAEAGGAGLRVLFHEYAHFLLGNTAGRTPAWFDEGVAQVYETLAVSNDRQAAIVGIALAEHVQFLQNSRLMPLSELLAVERSLDVYQDDRRRRLFYAQSWALAHYLMLGNRTRAPQLARYLERVGRGEPPAAAFTAAFETSVDQIEAEVRAYVRQFQFPALAFRFAGRVGERALAPVNPVGDGEAEAWLGDLLARSGRPHDAQRQLEALVAAQPDNARALASLGMLHLREARHEAGAPLLVRAAELMPDDAVIQAAYGAVLYDAARRAAAEGGEQAERTFTLAKAVLTRAARLDAESAAVQARLGHLETSDRNLAAAEAHFERALALAPSRHDYRLALGDLLSRRGALARASEELQLVVARATPDVAAPAQALLARLAIPPAEPVVTPPVAGPRLRTAGPGERQAQARLVAVECSGPLQVYRLEDGERVYRLSRPIGGVQLRTYRTDLPGALGCGDLPKPVPAVVTFVPGDATDEGVTQGVILSLDLVPDTYPAP